MVERDAHIVIAVAVSGRTTCEHVLRLIEFPLFEMRDEARKRGLHLGNDRGALLRCERLRCRCKKLFGGDGHRKIPMLIRKAIAMAALAAIA
jgi:hypothetical protein